MLLVENEEIIGEKQWGTAQALSRSKTTCFGL